MHRYSMFGLSVHSEVPLPDLPATQEAPDVTIQYGTVDLRRAPAQSPGGYHIANRFKSDYFDADLSFEIVEGRSLTVDPRGAIELKVLQAWVIQLMAVVMRQRGHLVLHGCAVARDGVAVAFLGESGWGKSTLAEFMVQRGYSFLTDDMLVLDTSHDPPSVLPGPQFIRLHPDVGAQLVADYDGLPRVSERVSKRSRSVERGEGAAVPVGKIYFLDNDAADSNRVEEIAGQIAVMNLLTHTRATNLLTDPASASRLLTAYADLLARVPVSKLRRIRSLDAMGDLVDKIESDLEQTMSSA